MTFDLTIGQNVPDFPCKNIQISVFWFSLICAGDILHVKAHFWWVRFISNQTKANLYTKRGNYAKIYDISIFDVNTGELFKSPLMKVRVHSLTTHVYLMIKKSDEKQLTITRSRQGWVNSLYNKRSLTTYLSGKVLNITRSRHWYSHILTLWIFLFG